jgi:hypothetical protein
MARGIGPRYHELRSLSLRKTSAVFSVRDQDRLAQWISAPLADDFAQPREIEAKLKNVGAMPVAHRTGHRRLERTISRTLANVERFLNLPGVSV